MKVNCNGKTVEVKDAWITNTMKALEITKEEAIQMYLEDEGYLDNEEQESLDEKAKAVKIQHDAKDITREKKERKKVERAASDDKQAIFQMIVEMLTQAGVDGDITKFNVVKKDKMVMIQREDKMFKLDLVETKTLDINGNKKVK